MTLKPKSKSNLQWHVVAGPAWRDVALAPAKVLQALNVNKSRIDMVQFHPSQSKQRYSAKGGNNIVRIIHIPCIINLAA